jgi:hypothetical protein
MNPATIAARERLDDDLTVWLPGHKRGVKYWWLGLGAAGIVGLIVVAAVTKLSGDGLVILSILVAAYFAAPVTLDALNKLGARERTTKPSSTSGGPRVGWDTALNPVLAELASAIRNVSDLEDIGERAGVLMERVRTSRRVDMYWQQVLTRALAQGDEVIDRVLDLAVDDSGSRELRQAIEQYRASRDA